MFDQLIAKKKVRALIYIMAVMIIFGATLTIIMLFRSCGGGNQNIYVKIGETNVTQIQPIKLRGLYPGSKEEYTLNITAEIPTRYNIDFMFKTIEDGGLRDFIDVEVTFDNVMLYNGTLSDLLDSDDVKVGIETNLDERIPIQIKISYKMPREVGNEAQGKSILFDINIIPEMK